jgi:hypothetical protein
MRHGDESDRETDGLPVVLVSLACGDYSCPCDEITALSALLRLLTTDKRPVGDSEACAHYLYCWRAMCQIWPHDCGVGNLFLRRGEARTD